MNALIMATESLRIANQIDGVTYCKWHLVSIDDRPVRATNGMSLTADFTLETAPAADYCIVFGGNLPTQTISEKLLSHLRHAARFGRHIGSVDTGLFALAQAGILSAPRVHQAVIHWEAAPGFSESFPEIELLDQSYLIHDHFLFSAGGVGTLDMMLDVLERVISREVSEYVASALIFHRPHATAPQKTEFAHTDLSHRTSERIKSIMEQHIENPLTLAEIAEALNFSIRTLERKTYRHFGLSPMRLYLEIRLRAARNHLFYEEHPVNVIALLCGFSSSSVFTRSFKSRFNMTPNQFRKSFRKAQLKELA